MRHLLQLLLLFFLLTSCNKQIHGLLEEPKHKNDNSYIKHFAYSLVYNEYYEQAEWVSYQLLKLELEPNYKRTNKFIEDSKVITGTANNTDYKKSGYDKGHLAPAADMSWNLQAMEESFYFSNISPQLPEFNRGIWKKLEENVRSWANKYSCLYITSGPICKNSFETIGENKVAIPTHFYKTILIYNDSIKQSIAFIFPHSKCTGELLDYAISVDSIESMTGLDFYYLLPDRLENDIENTFNLNYWNK